MADALSVGQQASDFTLKDQDQKEITLSSFKGNKNVVLAFYPLDFSPVCSKEHACFHEDFNSPSLEREDDLKRTTFTAAPRILSRPPFKD
jgi:peroxiredoxin